MNKLIKIAAVSALVLGMAGTANAIPMLQITGGVSNAATPDSSPTGNSWTNVGGAPDAADAENIGDPGGTAYANGPTVGASAGPGLPTATGGWPNSANFGMDNGHAPAPAYPPGCTPTVNCAMGISGYDGSFVNLTEGADVKFQFMGKGDATDHNQFQIWDPTSGAAGAWVTIWDSQSAANGTCGMTGTSPNCPNAGSTQTIYFDAGLLGFRFVNLTTPAIATNDGTNNSSPETSGLAGYFLGVDPYLASYDPTMGSAVYAGFTDRPCVTGAACDHDYEDTIVRISSVPEPGTIFLLGAGLLSFGVGRRKMAARSV